MKKTYLFLFLLPPIALGLIWILASEVFGPDARTRRDEGNSKIQDIKVEKGPNYVKTRLADSTKGARYAVDISSAAINYRDEKGQWQEINTNWEDSDNKSFTDKADRLPFKAYSDKVGKRRIYPDRNNKNEYIEFGALEYWTGTLWKQVALLQQARKGDTLIWDGENIVVEVKLSNGSVKEDIILKNEEAPTNFLWSFSLFGLKREGNTLRRISDNSVVATFPDPFLVDAKNVRRNLSYAFSENEVRVTVSTDELTFPITVDPTVDLQVTVGGNDGYWRENGVTFDNNSTTQYAGNFFGINNSFMLFSDVQVTQGATIDVAYISVRAQSKLGSPLTKIKANAADNPASPTSNAECAALIETTAGVDWDPSAWLVGTWYNSPSITTVIDEITDRTGWASGQAMLLLWLDDGTAENEYLTGRTSEYTGGVSGPKLHIEYTEAAPTATPTPFPEVGFEGVDMSGVCAGSSACLTVTPTPSCAQGIYTPSPSWTKIDDTIVRDISSLTSDATVNKDIYCDDNNCILWTDGADAPTTVCIATDSNVYGNILWDRFDYCTGAQPCSSTATWADSNFDLSGGDIGGTHPSGLKAGDNDNDASSENWLARDYTSATGTFNAMDVCKAKGAGWRLPNLLELDSIRDQAKGSNPYARLPNIAGNYYSSATETSTNYMMSITFAQGNSWDTLKAVASLVRCVRPY